MIVRICEVKIVACYARAETFTEAVASVGSMVATPLDGRCYMEGVQYYCVPAVVNWRVTVPIVAVWCGQLSSN